MKSACPSCLVSRLLRRRLKSASSVDVVSIKLSFWIMTLANSKSYSYVQSCIVRTRLIIIPLPVQGSPLATCRFVPYLDWHKAGGWWGCHDGQANDDRYWRDREGSSWMLWNNFLRSSEISVQVTLNLSWWPIDNKVHQQQQEYQW